MHISVLQKELLKYLNPQPNENFIDGTLDGGGHSELILKKTSPNGKILGIDLEEKLIQEAKLKIKKSGISENRLIAVIGNFRDIKKIAQENNFKNIDGIYFDLGVSNWHFEQSGRGFSFLRNEPLDMRLGLSIGNLTAKEIVNKWSYEKLKDILKNYGEERFANLIAKQIIESRNKRPIETSFDLVKIIKTAIPFNSLKSKIHPATRTFQALRIAVNDELKNLKIGLMQAFDILKSKGRLVVISFHSLEDRIVKEYFRELKNNNLVEILTKKPITSSQEEVCFNPKSRSAKLRAIIKN